MGSVLVFDMQPSAKRPRKPKVTAPPSVRKAPASTAPIKEARTSQASVASPSAPITAITDSMEQKIYGQDRISCCGLFTVAAQICSLGSWPPRCRNLSLNLSLRPALRSRSSIFSRWCSSNRPFLKPSRMSSFLTLSCREFALFSRCFAG